MDRPWRATLSKYSARNRTDGVAGCKLLRPIAPCRRKSTRSSDLLKNKFPGDLARERVVGRGDDRIRRRRIGNEDKLATLAIENRRLRSAQDRRGSCEIMNVNDGWSRPTNPESAPSATRQISIAQQWVAEHAAGKPAFVEYRKKHAAHPIEDVGRKLGGLMPRMRANQAKHEPVEAGGTADHGFRMM